MMTKTFTFWLPDEQKEELRRLAYEKNRRMSDMLRESISCFLEKERKKLLAHKSEQSTAE